MNDEIKEILELNGGKHNVYLPKEVKEAFTCIDYELSVCSCELPKILDYITNLQQEIKEANDSITWWSNRFKAVERDNRELQQENERLKEEKDNLYLDNTMIKLEKDIYKQGYEDFKNLINTLQNGSDDNE